MQEEVRQSHGTAGQQRTMRTEERVREASDQGQGHKWWHDEEIEEEGGHDSIGGIGGD